MATCQGHRASGTIGTPPMPPSIPILDISLVRMSRGKEWDMERASDAMSGQSRHPFSRCPSSAVAAIDQVSPPIESAESDQLS